MKRYFWIFLLAIITLAGCDQTPADEDVLATPPLEITEVRHSDNYKQLDLYARYSDAGAMNFDERHDSLKIREFNHNNDEVANDMVGRIVSIDNIGSKVIDSLGVNISVLVDLTLPQNLVDSERIAVTQISYLYNSDNLYVTFLHTDSLTSTFMFTDYVRDNYFVSEADTIASKHLYRGIYKMMCDLANPSTEVGRLKYCALVVFSDGNVYGMDETPIDPDHYQLQNDMLRMVASDSTSNPVFYFNLNNTAAGATNDAENFLQLLASRSHGEYNNSFNWGAVAKYIFDYYHLNYNDYVLHIEYPSDRLFSGSNTLKAYIVSSDTTQLLFETTFNIGNVCKPVIIDGESQNQVLMRGIILSLTLILLIYLFCQFIIPYFRYAHFLKNHVTTYQGPNTTLSGVTVGDVCYYCKAPFRHGDRVVAKCEHTMHESCWHENDCHCPEYGHKCKTGSHYYNPNDLFDPRNAYFYMPWLIASVAIAFFAWVGFVIYDQELTFNLLVKIYTQIKGIPFNSSEYCDTRMMIGDALNQLPSFGAFLGLVFTFILGWLASPKRVFYQKLANVALRSLISAICGYLFFLLEFIFIIVTDISDSSYLIDWVPWTATGITSVFAASYRTQLHPQGKWFFGMVLVGVISMFLWSMVFANNDSDYRVLIFVSNLIFSVGVTLTIAQPMPASGNYVLHVSGGVKEMDIALYKWFKRSPSMRVTIGRSIDCAIQTSWDVQGDVAPIHAEVVMHSGRMYLVPLEDGVYSGNRMLRTGRRFYLYHGRSFSIGTTRFIFHERDLH